MHKCRVSLNKSSAEF